MPLDDRALARWQNRHMGTALPVPPPRRKRNNEESRIQKAVIIYWRVHCKHFGLEENLLFKVANEGQRSEMYGKIMKDEGLRAGVSDLFLSTARGGFHGMYLEIKKSDGVVSDSQRAFLKAVGREKYFTRVAYSYDEAVAALEEYLKL